MDVTSRDVAFYLQRIYTLLNSDEESKVFSHLSLAMENILVNIVKDADFLKQGQFDDDCKGLAALITNLLDKNKDVYTLTYGIEGIGKKKILVYKKTPVPNYKRSIKPLRKPNLIQRPLKSDDNKNTAMSAFKTNCLNSTLRFVKNDLLMALQYPDMTTEQMEFVKQMISQCLARKEDTPGAMFKSLLDPLAEALRIFSLKYEFSLDDVPSMHSDMKRLKLQKIPKQKISTDIVLDTSKKTNSEPSKIQTNKNVEKDNPIRKVTDNTGHESMESNKEYAKNNTENSQLDQNISNNKFNTDNTKGLDKSSTVVGNTKGLYNNKNTKESDITKELDNKKNTKGLGNIEKIDVNTTVTKQAMENDYTFSKYESNYPSKTSQIPNEVQIQSKQLKSLANATTLLLTNAFKITSLKKIKEFMEDDKEKLLFSDLTIQQAEFLVNWKVVAFKNEIIKLFDINGQMILDEIRYLMNRSGGRIVTLELVINNVRSVTFSKTKGNEKLLAMKIANKEIECSSMPNPSGQIMDKKTVKFLNQTRKLSNEWVKTVLTLLKNFLTDQKEASLYIQEVTHEEHIFLNNWNDQLSIPEVIMVSHDAVQVLLNDIHSTVAQNEGNFRLSFETSELSRKQRRNCAFIKYPISQTKSKKALQTGLSEKSANVNAVAAISKTPRQQLKSTTVTSLTPSSLPLDKGEGARPKSGNLPRFKVKLMEGLNQPVVSEKGLKMMKCMGWDGGALGLRGEGIVEPIMLSLDMGNRAGLGSSKVPKNTGSSLPSATRRVTIQNNKTHAEMNSSFLQAILNLLLDGGPPSELCFKSQLSNKKWGFVRRIVYAFNMRSSLYLDQTVDKEISNKVSDIMRKHDYIITACWGTSRKNVLFILSNGPYELSESERKNWCSIFSIEDKKEGEPKEKEKEKACESIVLDGEAFRYYVLSQILEYCTNSYFTIDPTNTATEKVISLKGELTKKQISHVTDLIRRLNNKSRPSSDSQKECTVFNEILIKMEGFTLDVDFPVLTKDVNTHNTCRSIRLIKIFTKRPVTNSAAEFRIIQNADTNIESTQNYNNNNDIKKCICCIPDSCVSILLSDNSIETKDDNLKKSDEITERKEIENSFDSLKNETKKLIGESITKKTKSDNSKTDNQENDRTDKQGDNSVSNAISENVKNITVCGKIIIPFKMDKPKRVNQENNGTVLQGGNDVNMTVISQNAKENVKNITEGSKDLIIFETEKSTSDNTVFQCDNDVNKTAISEKGKENNKNSSGCAILPIEMFKSKTANNENNRNVIQSENDVNKTPISADAKEDDKNTTACEKHPNVKENVKTTSERDKCVIPIEIDKSKSDNQERDRNVLQGDNDVNMTVMSENAKENDQNTTEGGKDSIIIEIEISKSANEKDGTVLQGDYDVDMTIITESDKNTTGYENPIIIDIDKSKSDKQENDRTVKQGDIDALSDNDKVSAGYGTIPIEMNNSKNDKIKIKNKGLEVTDSDNKENTTKDDDISEVNNDILKLNNLSLDDYKSLKTAEIHLESVENILKEFVEDNNCDLLSAMKISVNKGNKELKRLSSIALTPVRQPKKVKYESYNKYVKITPLNGINKKMAADIQNKILQSINYTQELPLLKCHGIQDGGLIYSCHTEKSYEFIENLTKSIDLKANEIQKPEKRQKMAFKINSYIEESVDTILTRLERFNLSLSTKEWEVFKKEQSSEFIIVHVELDNKSYEYIRNEKYTLFVGLDEAVFSLIFT